MNILLSNDDGIKSNGLLVFARKLAVNNRVLVLAPDGNRSAFSHSISISEKLTLKKEFSFDNCEGYSLSGTPADCIKFAKIYFKDFNADLVISGINKGHNIGSDILYSGTVAIACEAAFFGNIAFAFSAYSHSDGDFIGYSDCAIKIMQELYSLSMGGDIWNVNFPNLPAKDFKGVKITKLGKQLYSDFYEKFGDNEFCLVGAPLNHSENDEDCDVELIKKGYVTVTPIIFDKTDYDKMEELKSRCIKL